MAGPCRRSKAFSVAGVVARNLFVANLRTTVVGLSKTVRLTFVQAIPIRPSAGAAYHQYCPLVVETRPMRQQGTCRCQNAEFGAVVKEQGGDLIVASWPCTRESALRLGVRLQTQWGPERWVRACLAVVKLLEVGFDPFLRAPSALLRGGCGQSWQQRLET